MILGWPEMSSQFHKNVYSSNAVGINRDIKRSCAALVTAVDEQSTSQFSRWKYNFRANSTQLHSVPEQQQASNSGRLN
jgi:hypothetical protein